MTAFCTHTNSFVARLVSQCMKCGMTQHLPAAQPGADNFDGAESYEDFQRDNLYRELRRGQNIIDRLKLYRENLITCPFESTPQMRARIDELSCECRDDFDRAVQMLLGDFKRLLGRVLETEKEGFPPGSCAHCGEFHSHICDAMKAAMANE